MKTTSNRTALALVLFCFPALRLPAAEAHLKTVTPKRGEIYRVITLPGSVKANQQATLYAKVGGYLKSLAVDKGDAVKAGQSLGEIEVPELLADLAKHKAELSVAEADFQRVSAARKNAADLVVQQSVDEAKGRLEIAKANLERTETLLAYAKITAPFAGIVTARFVDPGAFIPSATSGSAAQTAAIVTIADFSTVRAQVPVPEDEAARVQVGEPVRLTVEGLEGRSFEAKVSRISYALDDATRTMLMEADLPNRDLVLRPGMYARVDIGVEKHANALLLPSGAVTFEKAGASVFIVADGKAKKLPVKTGFNDGSSVELLDGLAPNQPVILAGTATLNNGQPVNLQEAK